MLKTLRESLNNHKSNLTFESFVLDSMERRETRKTMLEAVGAPESKYEDDEFNDEDIEAIIDTIPESDIDMDNDAIVQDLIRARDEQGRPIDITVDECIEKYIPDTEEIDNKRG